MNSNDILQCIFILIIFGLLFLVNILSVGIKNIEDNWPTYRCNPVVMPFAGLFGQDVMSNFNYCIQNIQSSYLSYLTLPMNYNLNIIGNLGGSLTTQIQSLRSFIDNLRDSITSIIQNVFNVFLNMLVQLQLMIVTIKDMMAKMIGVTVTQLYLITGFTDLMNSAYKGPPGQMVKALPIWSSGSVRFSPTPPATGRAVTLLQWSMAVLSARSWPMRWDCHLKRHCHFISIR